MAHDGFGHAAQCPALYAGAPVGAHGDQVVRNLLRQRNDLIGVKTLLDNGRDFFEATASERLRLFFEIRTRLLRRVATSFSISAVS